MKRIIELLILAITATGIAAAQTANGTVTITVTANSAIAATTGTMASSPTTGTTSTVFTITGSYSGSNNGVEPSGNVSVYNGTTLLATTALTQGTPGNASKYSCTVTNLPTGSIILTGVFGGDSNYLAGTIP